MLNQMESNSQGNLIPLCLLKIAELQTSQDCKIALEQIANHLLVGKAPH